MCKPVNRVQLVELVLGKVRKSGPGGRISTGHEREGRLHTGACGDGRRVGGEERVGRVRKGWEGCAEGGRGMAEGRQVL